MHCIFGTLVDIPTDDIDESYGRLICNLGAVLCADLALPSTQRQRPVTVLVLVLGLGSPILSQKPTGRGTCLTTGCRVSRRGAH